ncbi:hypothetical protein ICM49_07210 [Leucobacter sp. cx-169]|nr:hypothetical protein [Leucobacter sp. cx-169]
MDTNAVATDAQIDEMLAKIASLYADAGSGFQAYELHGVVIRDSTGSGCGGGYGGAAQAASALLPGRLPTDQIIMLTDPSCSGSSVGNGVASVGTGFQNGGWAWATIDGAAGRGLHALAHEMGHNYGIGHSNLKKCDAELKNCAEALEYYDIYDPMSLGWRYSYNGTVISNDKTLEALNAGHQWKLNKLSGDYVKPDLKAGESREFTLQAISGDGDTRAIVFETGDGRKIFLEYRDGSGRDSGALYADGQKYNPDFEFGVRLIELKADGSTEAFARSGANGKDDTTWSTGESFTIPGTGTVITVGAMGSGEVKVTVAAGLQGRATAPEAVPAVPQDEVTADESVATDDFVNVEVNSPAPAVTDEVVQVEIVEPPAPAEEPVVVDPATEDAVTVLEAEVEPVL